MIWPVEVKDIDLFVSFIPLPRNSKFIPVSHSLARVCMHVDMCVHFLYLRTFRSGNLLKGPQLIFLNTQTLPNLLNN
jgi:hypothetical protein